MNLTNFAMEKTSGLCHNRATKVPGSAAKALHGYGRAVCLQVAEKQRNSPGRFEDKPPYHTFSNFEVREMAITLYHPQWKKFPIQGVLFDMDGLVLDTEKLYTRFWMEAARDLGYPMTFQQALGLRSLNRSAGQAKLTEYFGPGISYTAVRSHRIQLMDAYIEKYGIEVKPGIFQLMDWLEENHIASAITSSSPMENIQRHLSAHGLLHRFDKLCSGYAVPNGKPEPDIYLYGAASLGLRPEACLALEDSPTGILSAHRAGCLPVMIPDQDQPDDTTAALLYAKADSLSDVISLLK